MKVRHAISQHAAAFTSLSQQAPDGASSDTCIHELVGAQAARTPDAVAVVCGNAQLTYRELDGRANQLAHVLIARGVGRDVFVAVCVERSLDMAIALLGVLKAGGAYVPLDPAYPAERLAHMVAETRAVLLLTQRKFAAHGIAPAIPNIDLDADWADIARESAEPPTGGAMSENLAYAMYTSGSTGLPRGVLVPHRGVVNHNLAIADYFGIRADDRVAQCTSLSFDIAVEEIFPAWMRGAAVVLHPPGVVGAGRDFCRWLCDQRISVVDLPTAFWHEWVSYLAHHDDALPAELRLVVVGGQKASAQVLATWKARTGSRVRWINGYGPTEATIASIFYSPDDEGEALLARDEDVPIGRPIRGTAAYILDAQGEQCAVGVTGELFLGGAGVARGYLNHRALTAEKFLPDPFSTVPGARMYRTGDLARRKRDGRIEFAGRVDDQVKVRGFRIELGEIEAALRQHPDVHDVAVVARDSHDHDKRLAGYVVLKRARRDTRVADLSRFLKGRLPAHMVPADLMILDALPLTPTGKTDKPRLPAPRATRESAGVDFVAPTGDVEIELARIWSSVLGIDEVGTRDNFFDLGGHSLRATQVASRIRDTFGIEIPLAEIFAQLTIAELARVVEAHRHEPGTRVARIPVAPRDRPIPLSFSQERVWFLQQLDPESLAYNFQTLLYFTGPLDVAALRASLDTLIERHEILRTSFSDSGGVPSQHIHPPFAVDLPIVDLRELSLDTRDAELFQRIDAETARPFDMSRLPLIRWTLFRLRDDEYAMLHVEHHLVHDGWSFNVFRRELLQLYLAHSGGAPSPLAPAPIQFADYAVWQREWMSGDVLRGQLDYWARQLADAPVLELPTDRARPLAQTFKGAVHEITLSGELYAALRSLSDALGTTLFITLEAAFFVLLHRYSGQDDVCIGSGVANRRWTETESLLGMLVNNVVLRSILRDDPSFRSFVSDVKQTTLEAFANQDAPFDHVVRAVGTSADSSRNPLFQVMFSFHDSPLDEPTVPDIDFRCVELLSNRSAKFDLNVVAVPHAEQRSAREREKGPDGITLIWEYNTALFDAATVEQMAGHYRTLLGSIAAAPDTSVFGLEMMDEAERQSILLDRNRTSVAYPSELTIHAKFEEQVERTPDSIAVVSGDTRLTYRELNTRANQLAHRLHDEGVAPGATVGVCLDRSIEMLVGLLSILKAGGAYVPLDPGYPDDRLVFVAQETRAQLVLTDARTHARCARWAWPTIDLSAPLADSLQYQISNPDVVVGPLDLAYVIFTSGSTGRPKGVAVPHRSVLRLLFGVDYVELGSHRRILHMAPLSFDSSTFEIWGALLHGATCVLHVGHVPTPKELGAVLRAHDIDTLWLTASMFNAVIDDAPEALAGVRQLLAGGEALSVPHVCRAQAALPNTTIVNGYGPTESTTFTCCHRLTETIDASSRSVPIGRPIANTKVYLLDRCLTPVPVGVAGELCIAGDGLARGYAGQSTLTAEKFIPDPFGVPGSRMYRTGDFARYRRDGFIEFVGRVDDQVKIRGYRIELGEIENVLRQHASVRDAAVIVRDDVPGGKALVAYVTSAAGDVALDVDALREHLRLTLPVYMIPARFVVMDALPLSPTGKVSRRLLPAPSADISDSHAPFVSASTDAEQAVAGIWKDVLKLERLSVDDNFFDLGGHSLLATQIVARIRDETLVDLPLRTLFEHPTVAGLARRISEEATSQFRDRRGSSPWRYLFLLKPNAGGSPIFFLPGGHGGDYEFLVYARLVHFVGDGFTFYGLRARSADGVEAAHASVEEMARDYIAELRAVQPIGPYRLVGNCIGGIVAYEVARQLERAGLEVRTLVLMDTEFPTRERYLRELWSRSGGQISPRLKLSYFGSRLSHHAQKLRSIPWRRRLSYLLGRARTAIKEPPAVNALDLADRVKLGYVDVLRRYRPRTYRGPVSIIASQHDETDPKAGWAEVVRGRITVHAVQGDHESYIRDFVKEAALRLRICLDQ